MTETYYLLLLRHSKADQQGVHILYHKIPSNLCPYNSIYKFKNNFLQEVATVEDIIVKEVTELVRDMAPALLTLSGCHKDGQSGLRQTRKGTHRDRDDGDEPSAMVALSV
ncbi:UNVERIFIED_CONTAM: hypothetical protein FKN15_010871 [Acipenser sinensis]